VLGPVSMRLLSWVMAAVFALAVAVQWNDPDPLGWMLIYGAAAAVSACAALGVSLPRTALALAIAYAAAALYLVPAILSSDLGAYTSFKMRSSDDEVARECVGLILCAVWMGVVWRRQAHLVRR